MKPVGHNQDYYFDLGVLRRQYYKDKGNTSNTGLSNYNTERIPLGDAVAEQTVTGLGRRGAHYGMPEIVQ